MMAIESAAIPLPSEVIMPFAGWFLIRDRGLPIWWLVVAALLGALGNHPRLVADVLDRCGRWPAYVARAIRAGRVGHT